MKIEIPVVTKDDVNHWLGVEVENDVVIVSIDNEELFKTDLKNFEELITTMGLVWLDWERTKKEVKS